MAKQHRTWKESIVRLSAHVKLREEYFGGIVFHKNTGDTVEVDREAYEMLVWLPKAGATDMRGLLRQKQARDTLTVLLDMNIIEYLPEKTPDTPDFQFMPYQKTQKDNDISLEINRRNRLSAPETVHLAVTYKCGENCPDCYARRHIPFVDYELDTAEMCGIIDALAESGIFQLAIGGGEPFMRNDLSDIVSHAARKGLVVHITTGQYTLKPQYIDVLNNIKSLHIGIRSEELIHDEKNTSKKLHTLKEYACNTGISLGANLIMTRFTLLNIDKLTELLLECGFNRFIFLRYKPVSDRVRWNNENPGANELKSFKNWLIQTKHNYSQLMLRVDCASAFLMRDMDLPVAVYAGIKGCAAGERIISVAPDGSVYPCSQLVGHNYKAGNLINDTFKNIWQESDILSKYRNFRQKDDFIDGVCGQCGANHFCGGCRIFAKDAVGSEPFCPMEQ